MTPEEAVAIAQQLIHRTQHTPAQPSLAEASTAAPVTDRIAFGPPTPENVYLESDGSVSCPACDVTPTVSEVAGFLQQALTLETMRIRGSLRYTIARGLLDVDAPPFDSLEEFSDALSRYERGDRAMCIRRVLDRAGAALSRGEFTRRPAVDRRRATPEIFELRRQLRESDARIYDQQLALDALDSMAEPRNRSRYVVIAAGLAIGLSLVGAGELMHSHTAPVVEASREAMLSADERQAADAAPVERELVSGPAEDRGGFDHASEENEGVSRAAVDRERSSRGSREPDRSIDTSRSRERFNRASEGAGRVRASEKHERDSEASPKVAEPHMMKVSAPVRRAPRSPGLLDRLHLGWLRSRIVIRHDDL